MPQGVRRRRGRPDGQVTISDVAARAGVSLATVSRVVNSNYPVASATRDRVERAIRDLGYVVNAHARALAGATNRTVGIIVNELVDPFFAYIARGVEHQARQSGRLCLVCCTRGDANAELAFIDLLHEQRADAVILVGGAYDDPRYASELARRARALHASGTTLVLCGRPPLGGDVPAATVEYDNEAGGYAVTDHLLHHGHRRILYLGGLPELSTTAARLAGHHRARRTRGLTPDPALVHTGSFGRDFGYRQLRTLLRSGPEFTAVSAANDLVAAGAYQAVLEQGLRIPEDISVVGYDDVPVARDLRPGLTTVHVPLEELGRAAVRLVVGDDSDPQHAADQRIRIGTHVVVRGSVAPPRSREV